MRALFLVVFASFCVVQTARAEQLQDTTAQILPFKFDPHSSPIDWSSKDVRIERAGDFVRIVFRRMIAKGERRIEVRYGVDESDSSVTLLYWINVFVGPITSKGLNFDKAETEIVWIFKAVEFEKLHRAGKFYMKCAGDSVDIG